VGFDVGPMDASREIFPEIQAALRGRYRRIDYGCYLPLGAADFFGAGSYPGPAYAARRGRAKGTGQLCAATADSFKFCNVRQDLEDETDVIASLRAEIKQLVAAAKQHDTSRRRWSAICRSSPVTEAFHWVQLPVRMGTAKARDQQWFSFPWIHHWGAVALGCHGRQFGCLHRM
jgi:hypothetical protein